MAVREQRVYKQGIAIVGLQCNDERQGLLGHLNAANQISRFTAIKYRFQHFYRRYTAEFLFGKSIAQGIVEELHVPVAIFKRDIKAIAGKNGFVHFRHGGFGVETVNDFCPVLSGQEAPAWQYKHNVVVDRPVPKYFSDNGVVEGFSQFVLRMAFYQVGESRFQRMPEFNIFLVHDDLFVQIGNGIGQALFVYADTLFRSGKGITPVSFLKALLRAAGNSTEPAIVFIEAGHYLIGHFFGLSVFCHVFTRRSQSAVTLPQRMAQANETGIFVDLCQHTAGEYEIA